MCVRHCFIEFNLLQSEDFDLRLITYFLARGADLLGLLHEHRVRTLSGSAVKPPNCVYVLHADEVRVYVNRRSSSRLNELHVLHRFPRSSILRECLPSLYLRGKYRPIVTNHSYNVIARSAFVGASLFSTVILLQWQSIKVALARQKAKVPYPLREPPYIYHPLTHMNGISVR